MIFKEINVPLYHNINNQKRIIIISMTKVRELTDTIIKGIQEKKGQKISIVDLRGIEGAICSYFVICQGNSPMQVEAITDSIEEFARVEQGEKPTHVV